MINWRLLWQSAEALRERFARADIRGAVVLTSGLSPQDGSIRLLDEVGFDEIQAVGCPTVAGHKGRFQLVECKGKKLILILGRRHAYEMEDTDFTPVVAPVFLAREMGARTLILTAATGGLNKRVGEFVVIGDHYNGSGISILADPNDERWGARFPDQTAIYNPALRAALSSALTASGGTTSEGVYIGLRGPTYETPFEVQHWKNAGGSVIGMSVVHDAAFANAGGMKVGGVALVCNLAAGISPHPLGHEEVLQAANDMRATFQRFFLELVDRL